MSPAVKFLIGLAAAAATGWIHYGPLGHGEAFLQRIEAEAQAGIAKTEVPVRVRMSRDPPSRVAILSGPADQFQREGQGSLKGVNDIVREVEGVSDIRWTDDSGRGAGTGTMPLLLEILAPVLLAYLLGVVAGWLFFGRRKRDSYL